MKKILLFAAAVLAFASCTDKSLDDTPKQDKIELSSNSATFTQEAAETKVIVTSTGAWTLASKEACDWATPDVFKGVDGDIVKFQVAENFEADRTVVYTFTCGDATADFTIISVAGERPSVKLVSDAEVILPYEETEFSVVVAAPIEYRQLTFTLSEGADWLTRKAVLPGDADDQASAKFLAEVLGGLDNREATITIAGEGLVPAVVTVKQLAKEVLTSNSQYYKSELAGGEVVVPLTTNVEYKIDIADEGKGWLTHDKKGENGEIFKVAPLESGSRTADVTFTQTNAKTGVEPLVFTAHISQVGTLIQWAAKMNGNRLFPKWENTDKLPSGNYSEFTLECLFQSDNFNRAPGSIYTLMGIEGKFLLRFGDIGNPVDHLQLALDGKNYNLSYVFEPMVWYHLAVTYDAGKITIYVNGEQIFNGDDNYRSSVNLFPAWSYEPSGNRTFWYGYSYNKDRDFNGLMTEMRAWAKALTVEEINAPNHFYTVPEDSEFLMTYWKMTEGEGDVIANKASHPNHALVGNPLHGELNIEEIKDGWSSTNKGTPGIEWVPVALPVM